MDQDREKPKRIPALSALFPIPIRRSLLPREAGNPFTLTNRRTGIRFNHRIQLLSPTGEQESVSTTAFKELMNLLEVYGGELGSDLE